MKKILFVILSFWCLSVSAQTFDDFFEDKTLRLDYIMAGDASKQDIFLEEMMCYDRWAGRRTRLSEMFLRGNGQLVVREHSTKDIIYVWTFSTLFQEWLQYDEAKVMKKAFEASYNIPFPKKVVDVTISLTDNHGQVLCETTHTIDPKDILIKQVSLSDVPFYYVSKGESNLTKSDEKGNKETEQVNKETGKNSRNFTYSGYDPFEGLDFSNCVDIAIVAEGYTESQMGKFYADCQRSVSALFEREPFKSLKNKFNVVAVASPSKQAGPSVPHKGVWKEGACGTHYDTFYSNRYLMTQSIHKIYDILNGIPFEHVIVLVNSDTYGGGGIYNQVTVSTSDHPTFKEVLVHEFGHGYGGLGDEYAYDDMDEIWYPSDTEPWEPNITTLKDFDSKWADMMPKNQKIPTPLDAKVPNFKTINKNDVKSMARLNACTQVIGVFEGAGYQSKGCYRPAQECRMKINEVWDFCPVCNRAITRITEFYTSNK